MILLVPLYGYETWFLILREEHRLKVFENKVLRRNSGLKRDEVKVEKFLSKCTTGSFSTRVHLY
jgi:hypothetical protein